MKQRKWEEASQGPDEADGNPVHLLRHTHGKLGAAGGQDRTESTVGGLLKRKHAHKKVLSKGWIKLCLSKRMGTNKPTEMTGTRYKNVNLMDRKQQIDGDSRLPQSKKTINDNPYTKSIK